MPILAEAAFQLFCNFVLQMVAGNLHVGMVLHEVKQVTWPALFPLGQVLTVALTG